MPYHSGDSLRRGVIRRIRTGAGGGDPAVLSAAAVLDSNKRFPVPRRVLEVPYWTSIIRRVAAQADDSWAIAISLVYPIHLLQGNVIVDSLSRPPASWRVA